MARTALALIAEADEILGRTMRIVNRVCPAFPFDGFSVSPEARAHDWASIDRARERRRLHAAILPRIRDKVRYGRTN